MRIASCTSSRHRQLGHRPDRRRHRRHRRDRHRSSFLSPRQPRPPQICRPRGTSPRRRPIGSNSSSGRSGSSSALSAKRFLRIGRADASQKARDVCRSAAAAVDRRDHRAVRRASRAINLFDRTGRNVRQAAVGAAGAIAGAAWPLPGRAASMNTSHSLSSPIERLFMLAEPTRTHLVIDDHQLGMDIDRRAARGVGHIDAEPARRGRVRQCAWSSRTRAPSIAACSSQPSADCGIDQDEFGRIGLVQALGNRLGNRARGEVLVFGIDEALGAARYARGTAPRPRAPRQCRDRRRGCGQCRSRHRGIRRASRRGQALSCCGAQGVDRLAASRVPAFAAQIAQRAGSIALDHHRQVVPGAIELAVGSGGGADPRAK